MVLSSKTYECYNDLQEFGRHTIIRFICTGYFIKNNVLLWQGGTAMADCQSLINNQSINQSINQSTRSNGYKLIKQRLDANLKLHIFLQRVINDWNSLPDYIVSAPDAMIFNSLLDI